MLFQTETGFIDIVIEPQFTSFQFGSQLASVRSSDLTSLQRMTSAIRADIDFRQQDTAFPFTGFAYLDDLCRQLKTKTPLVHPDYAPKNFSRAPVAYSYLGFEADYDYNESDQWQGSLLPSEVFDFQYSTGLHLEYFRVWPLFYVPEELREDNL